MQINDNRNILKERTDMKLETQKCIDESPKPPHFGFTPVKTHPTNIRYYFKDDDKIECSIDDIVLPKTTAHVNYSINKK